MVPIYGEDLSNAKGKFPVYLHRYLSERCPAFKGLWFFYHLVNRNRGCSRSRRVLNLEPEILQAIEEELNGSCRRITLRMDASSFTICRTLHEQGLLFSQFRCGSYNFIAYYERLTGTIVGFEKVGKRTCHLPYCREQKILVVNVISKFG
jgi:hypothetical protein